ncbi:MAG: type VI secretion system-associated protein TagF [Janthinobacterium lividum]
MSRPGFYGKLASLGDFVSRDLPREFIQPWDSWLAAGLHSSQQHLGDQWLEAYLISPLWRFTLASGVCGQDSMAGVIMPSVDRVGRYFPLTVAQPLERDTDLASLVAGPQDWFEGVEQALLDTLQAEAELAQFVQALDRLPPLTVQVAPLHEQVDGLQRSAATTPEARLAVLAQWACAGTSLWWGCGSERVDAGLVRCVGLPPEQAFSAFLQAQRGMP